MHVFPYLLLLGVVTIFVTRRCKVLRYREKCFQWYRNDMIYLMEDNDSRKINEGNAEKEAEKYYCFSADGKSDEEILNGLDSLLNQNVNDK